MFQYTVDMTDWRKCAEMVILHMVTAQTEFQCDGDFQSLGALLNHCAAKLEACYEANRTNIETYLYQRENYEDGCVYDRDLATTVEESFVGAVTQQYGPRPCWMCMDYFELMEVLEPFIREQFDSDVRI